MKKLIAAALGALLLVSGAAAQHIGPGQLLGNPTGVRAPASPTTVDALFDQALGATANRVVCNLAGVWQSCAQPILGSVGTMGTIAFLGSTSGTVTLTPQATAGTPTLTFPNASGTFAVGGTAPVTVNTTTGAIGISTNGISNSLFRQSVALSVVGNPTNGTADVQDIAAASDAQIMRRSGTSIGFGSIDLASANAVSTTLLRMVNGGCNAALTASNGGLLYSTATGCAILAGTATAGQIPRSGSSAAPSWSTATYPATTAQGTVLASASANVIAGTATPVLGIAGTTLGSIGLAGNTSGVVTIQPQAAAGTYNFNLPTGAGSSGQPLLSGGGGATAQTYGTLSVGAGGTSNTTAAGARTSTGLNIDQMSTTGDADVSIAATTRVQATTTTLTAVRTWTLPAANAVNAGQTLTISDKAGAINGANTLTIQRAGADTINGSTSFAMASQYQQVTLVSDGVSIWNYAASAGGGSGTVTSVGTSGILIGGAITTSGTISVNASITPQGRITLTSGTPVMTTTTVNQTTVYYTPYAGDLVPLYDGTNMVPTAFTELSQATTDTTKSPAAAANNSNYDIFVWNDGGTIRATRGPAWTNDTTRSAGTALTMVKGIYLNNASITNGPGASRGTYVGTIRTDGSAQVDYDFGSVTANWGPASFGVWNAYNRVRVSTFIGDTSDSWTYNVALTWRAPNGNTTTARVSTIRGLNEDGVDVRYHASGAAGAATYMIAGLGLNSTTAKSQRAAFNNTPTNQTEMTASFSGLMGLGFNFISAIELNQTTTASTWLGDAAADSQTGLAWTSTQ